MKMNGNDENSENVAKNRNGMNNNHEEFKMEIKQNNAENDPLTGSKNWTKMSKLQRFRQRIASPNTFMAVFLLAYAFQGTYFTYFVSVMGTIEKVFHISSAKIAIVLNFSEVGQICTSLFLTYYAGRGHRPRFIAIGTMIFSIAAFLSLLPHFIFYSSLYDTDTVVAQSSTFKTTNDSATNSIYTYECLDEDTYKNLSLFDKTCAQDKLQDMDQNKNKQIQSATLVIFSVSLLFIGIGQTALTTLGIPCIDDNVKAAQSSLYIAITFGVRILGPLLGYYIGSYCMSKYVDLSKHVDPSNTNFIGAWWLGIVIVATCMFFSSLVMFLFPKNLRKSSQVTPETAKNGDNEKNNENEGELEKTKEEEINEEEIYNTDFVATIKRHLKNKVFMLRTMSAVFHLLPITGLYIFLPRYLETQFLIPTNQATFISGTFGILTMGLGIAITGIISAKYHPTVKQFSSWVAVSAFMTAVGLFILMFVKCSMEDNFKGIKSLGGDSMFTSSKVFEPICNASTSSCLCDDKEFAPLCGSDGNIYYSACHAGCKSKNTINQTAVFSECSCIAEPNFTASAKTCYTGRCDTNLYIFVAIFAFTFFIHATSEVGRMVIVMRCVHPRDKTMAMGIVQFSQGVFSNIPCPNIYAAIVNASCIVWNNVCGSLGHCTLYDSDTFRLNFFGVSSFIMLLAWITDMLIFYDVDEIEDFNPDTKKTDKTEENLLKSRKNSEIPTPAEEVPMKISLNNDS